MRRTYTAWTPEQDKLLVEFVNRGAQDYEIAHEFTRRGIERSVESVRNRCFRLSLTKNNERIMLKDAPPEPPHGTPEQSPEDIRNNAVEQERVRQERLRNLRAEREAIRDIASERSLRSMLDGLFREIVPAIPVPPAPRIYKPNADCTSETLLLHLSDWHYGEIVRGEGTRGMNSYDGAIATDRVHSVIHSAMSIADKMKAGGGWDFPRMVVALNGDLVSGTIHELERHSDPKNIIWSVYECGMLLADAMRRLRSAFPRVDVFCTSGNHGRLPDARKMQSKDPTRNWDTLVALIAKTALRDVPGITFHIPDSYSVAYECEGMTVLQTHGHDIKSWSGIPWYGINRFLGNYNGLEASRGGSIGAYLFGHFHSQTNITYPGGEAFVNGSLIGGTEWTINALGKSDRPCQMMLGIHRNHGVTHRWPIYAEGE